MNYAYYHALSSEVWHKLFEAIVITITVGLWLGLTPFLLGYLAYWAGSSEVDERRQKLLGWIIPRYFAGLLLISLASYLVIVDRTHLDKLCCWMAGNWNLIVGISLWVVVAITYVYLFVFRLRSRKRELEEGGS